MKLTNDNYEMVMFDLLEGNLSEEQELDVMRQIEENDRYFKEWKLFKATVLAPDESVVFENKKALMKKEPKVIVFQRRWVNISIAASLLLGIVFLWPQFDGDDTVVSQPSTTNVPTVDPIPVDPTPEVVALTPETENGTVKTETTTPIYPIRSIDNSEEQRVVETAIDPENLRIEALPHSRTQHFAVAVPNIVTDNPYFVESLPVASAPLDLGYVARATQFVTSSPAKRISNKASELIANLANPKLKFKPELNDKRPGLQIEFDSRGYHAVASIEPFRKEIK